MSGDGWDFGGGASTPASSSRPSFGASWDGGDAPAVAQSAPAADRSPFVLAVAATATAIAGLAIGLSRPDVTSALVAWLLSGFVTIGLIAAHTLAESRAATRPEYTVRPILTLLVAVAVAGALGGVIISALRIAYFAGRTWTL